MASIAIIALSTQNAFAQNDGRDNVIKDTSRSDAIVAEFKQRSPVQVRTNYSFTGTWKASPNEIFLLLDPAREADWIPTWSAKILYSSDGYGEDKVIFETPENSAAGEGLWTFTTYDKDHKVEYVGFSPDKVTHGSVTVIDNGNGTTSATWDITVTAITEEGAKKVAKLPKGVIPNAPAEKLVKHFLDTGELADLSVLGNVHD